MKKVSEKYHLTISKSEDNVKRKWSADAVLDHGKPVLISKAFNLK